MINILLQPTSVDRKEGMCQCPTNAIKRISIPVFSVSKLDINVNRTVLAVDKVEISYICPHLR